MKRHGPIAVSTGVVDPTLVLLAYLSGILGSTVCATILFKWGAVEILVLKSKEYSVIVEAELLNWK